MNEGLQNLIELEKLEISELIISKIKQKCQSELDDTDIKKQSLCEINEDYYIFGKVSLAKEILKEINKLSKLKRVEL